LPRIGTVTCCARLVRPFVVRGALLLLAITILLCVTVRSTRERRATMLLVVWLGLRLMTVVTIDKLADISRSAGSRRRRARLKYG